MSNTLINYFERRNFNDAFDSTYQHLTKARTLSDVKPTLRKAADIIHGGGDAYGAWLAVLKDSSESYVNMMALMALVNWERGVNTGVTVSGVMFWGIIEGYDSPISKGELRESLTQAH